jgi:hypothetical protein
MLDSPVERKSEFPRVANCGIAFGLVIGSALYAPFGMYVYGYGVEVVIDRLYFMCVGALAVMLANIQKDATP